MTMMDGFGESDFEIVYRYFPYFSKRSEKEVNLTLASARVFFLTFFYGKILIAKLLDILLSYKNVRLKSLL